MDRNIAITILAVGAIAFCGFCLVDDGNIDVDAADSGSCGTNLSWSFSDDGTLSITGSGTMSNYSKGRTPWNSYMSQITAIGIGGNVTSISQYAFAGSAITSIVIPNSVESIGAYAFDGCSSLQTITIGTGLASWDDSVFRNCTSVTTIDINAVSASKDFTVSSYNNECPFSNCGSDAASATRVTFGSSVQSITPYHQWNEKLRYNIHFVMNCSETMDPIVLFEDDVIASSITGIPARDDYNFAGWYLDAELTIPLDPQALPTEDMTLYASWEEKPFMSGTTLTIIAVVVCAVLSVLAIMFVRR